MPGAEKTTDQWSAEARFAVIVETATLSEEKIAEYCRKKGLYSEQVIQWKQYIMQTENPNNKAALKQSLKENKQLTSCTSSTQMCSNCHRRLPTGRSDINPFVPYRVNQLIQRPTDERAQQSVLATSLIQTPRCSINMAFSLLA